MCRLKLDKLRKKYMSSASLRVKHQRKQQSPSFEMVKASLDSGLEDRFIARNQANRLSVWLQGLKQGEGRTGHVSSSCALCVAKKTQGS